MDEQNECTLVEHIQYSVVCVCAHMVVEIQLVVAHGCTKRHEKTASCFPYCKACPLSSPQHLHGLGWK